MKTHSSFRLGLLTATVLFAMSTAFAAAPKSQGYSHPVGAVERYGETLVARGSTRLHVVTVLGRPYRQLSANVWAYRNFHGGNEQSPDDDCSTLLITFVEDEVVDLKLVNYSAEKIIAAQIRARSENLQVAAK